ncbi:MAG: Crp/Fnr family transcriptional regulator [Peptococcaceae bacterium]
MILDNNEDLLNLFELFQLKYNYKEPILQNFLGKGEKIYFEKKKIIEPGYKMLNYVYLILTGRVRQYFLDSFGYEKTILILSPGDIFGEITLFQEDLDRVVTEAIEDTMVVKISKGEFLSTLKKHPELYDAILKMVTTKFRILMDQIYDLSYYSTKDKLINLLKRLAKQNGEKIECGIKINIKLTHYDIAKMIGTTRETITKLLPSLKRDKIIDIKDKYIIVLKN